MTFFWSPAWIALSLLAVSITSWLIRLTSTSGASLPAGAAAWALTASATVARAINCLMNFILLYLVVGFFGSQAGVVRSRCARVSLFCGQSGGHGWRSLCGGRRRDGRFHVFIVLVVGRVRRFFRLGIRLAVMHLALAALQIAVADELVAVQRGFFQQVGGVEQVGALVDHAHHGADVADVDRILVVPDVAGDVDRQGDGVARWTGPAAAASG